MPGAAGRALHKRLEHSVVQGVKFEVDEELWYGVSSDDEAEAAAAKSMAARMGRILGAKPFPAAAQRLTQLTQDPNCSMDDVVGALESDPALSARLLRLVNSVGFALRTACTSVRHAAALVGTEKLNQVASTAAILDMYESRSEQAATILEHATVVGALCRYMAFHFGLPPDELFTCGFLHDIGKLMLLETEGDEYIALLGSEEPDFDTLYVEERKRFGYDHALLAGHVLAAWNIPDPVPKVVAWHHHVTRAYAESTEISQMVSTLRLADAMSFALRKPDEEQQISSLARMEAASYLDISEAQLAAMWDEVRSLTERARAVFRGEEVPEPAASKPSAQSLRAVADAREVPPKIHLTGSAPPTSERPKQFPCVVCNAPSYAHRCTACGGYACPRHMGKHDEWCELCQGDYEATGIPRIRPVTSTLLGAGVGTLLALAFFGAASAGAQRPMRLALGPTLMLMLLGMFAGVGHRWVRRWWFMKTRPNRRSMRPPPGDSFAEGSPRASLVIRGESAVPSTPGASPRPSELGAGAPEPAAAGEARRDSHWAPGERSATSAASTVESGLARPHIPSAPALPDVEVPRVLAPSRAPSTRARKSPGWMSKRPKTVPSPALSEPPAPRSGTRSSGHPKERVQAGSAAPAGEPAASPRSRESIAAREGPSTPAASRESMSGPASAAPPRAAPDEPRPAPPQSDPGAPRSAVSARPPGASAEESKGGSAPPESDWESVLESYGTAGGW